MIMTEPDQTTEADDVPDWHPVDGFLGRCLSTSATFEVFPAQICPKRLEANQASLTKTNILISESLAKKFGNVKRVVLLFNRETQEIGIRPTGPKDVGGYKLSCRSVSSSSFYQHFQIEARGRFAASVDALGMIVIRLREPQS